MANSSFQHRKCQRKQSGSTVIAHISDLHFTKSTSKEQSRLRAALEQDLSRHNIDLLAVTGDVVDSSILDNFDIEDLKAEFANVATYLRGLCSATRLDASSALMVVPGNHDFRLSGFLGMQKCQFDLFQEAFKESFNHCLFPHLGLCVFVFNSNTQDKSFNFGTGLVDEEDLIASARIAKDISQQHPKEWETSTRIALVHHHPMPIAATEHRDKTIDKEWFIVFKNAGLFMTELVKSGFDLVLHGHKHYPGYSRAIFPTNDGGERRISVVAAGSVGKHGLHLPSYNLVTVFDTGEITLVRRSLEGATYAGDKITFLIRYEDARPENYLRLARRTGSQLVIQKYIRLDKVQSDCGDCDCQFVFESVRSFSGKPIPEIRQRITTESGRLGKPSCECTTIKQTAVLEFQNQFGPEPIKEMVTRFDPPIESNPIDYSGRIKIFNGIHFNQQDRLDATNQIDREEMIFAKIVQACESLYFQVSFPSGLMPMPNRLKFYVLDENGNPHNRERAFAAKNVTVSEGERTAVLALEKPLPGYTYGFKWELARNEVDQLNLSPIDAGRAQDIIQRLGTLNDERHRGTGRKYLETLVDGVAKSKIFAGLKDDSTLEATLYTYNESKHGLVCVAAVGNYTPSSKLWSWVIPPGRTLNGRAYRRKAHVLWINIPGALHGEDELYESDPDDNTNGKARHTVILAIPLLYPLRNGRKVGVLTLASRSNTSPLLLLGHDKAALLALLEESMVWYDNLLKLFYPAITLGEG